MDGYKIFGGKFHPPDCYKESSAYVNKFIVPLNHYVNTNNKCSMDGHKCVVPHF